MKRCARCEAAARVEGRIFCASCERVIVKLAETATPTGEPDVQVDDDEA